MRIFRPRRMRESLKIISHYSKHYKIYVKLDIPLRSICTLFLLQYIPERHNKEDIKMLNVDHLYKSYQTGRTKYEAVSYTHLDVYKRQTWH